MRVCRWRGRARVRRLPFHSQIRRCRTGTSRCVRKRRASRRVEGAVQGSAVDERALCLIAELQMVSCIHFALKPTSLTGGFQPPCQVGSPNRSNFIELQHQCTIKDEADDLNYIALPHADVDTKDFYKHIDQTLPEPHRMRHLLTWCSARALPDKVPGGNRDPNEALAVDAGKLIGRNAYFCNSIANPV